MSTPEEAKAVIRRWNEEGWSGGKYELAYEIISPDMVVHGAGGQTVGMGPDGLIDLIRTWRTAFADGHMEIDDLIVEGDTVAIRNTWYGTHGADFYGIPPSGNRVAVTSVGIDRVQGGLVTEGWGELDMVGMMQQLGAMPMVGPGAVAAGGPATWGPTHSADPDGAGSAGENKAVLERFVAALAAGDEDAVRDVVDTEAFTDHSPGWNTTTLDAVLEAHAVLRRALPDLRFEVDASNMVCEGNQVAAHSIVRGTHTGEALYGAEPSGNEVVWTHTDFVRINGGRIVERWSATDMLTLFQQAGVLPSPEAPPAHPRECSFDPSG
jgi:predicted ester cyclase